MERDLDLLALHSGQFGFNGQIVFVFKDVQRRSPSAIEELRTAGELLERRIKQSIKFISQIGESVENRPSCDVWS